MEQVSVFRATLLVAVAAVVEAVIGPYLTFGGIAPRLTLLGIVVAVSGLQETQGLLIGFFGGVLMDALGEGLFGVGALGGLVAGAISVRVSAMKLKGAQRLILAQAVAVSVVAYDLIHLFATHLAGLQGPSVGAFVVHGVIPDALVNAVLAYLIGLRLMKLLKVRRVGWT